MTQSFKKIYSNLIIRFLSLKIYNQYLYLHLILMLALAQFTVCHCEQFTLLEKWDILLKFLDPSIDSDKFETQFLCLEYLNYFKQQVSVDLCLLTSKQEIYQYSKFLIHMCEITQDYYDQVNRDYTAHKSYVQDLHIKQWSYWYQIKLLRP